MSSPSRHWSVAAIGLAVLVPFCSPGSARAASPTPVPATARSVSVVCPQIGEVTIDVRDDAPPAAVGAPPGVTLRVAYDVRERRTAVAVRGGEQVPQPCAQVPVRGLHPSALPGFPAQPGVSASDLLDGTLTLGLVVTEQAAAPTPLSAAAVPGAGSALPFEAAVRAYLATRSGHASVAVFDAKTGATYSYAAGSSFVTASIVKASILGTLLGQAQSTGRGLTSTETSLATRMIQQSDNAAASTLWNQVGKGPAVGAFMRQVGMASTTPGTGGYWGLTTTNAPDQVKLVRAVAYPNTVLAGASRSYEETLMRGVTRSQRWGVTGGVPSGATVALKNGWLPRSNGWVINSIGHVRGADRDYAIAVLSSGSPSMSYGIATVERLSSLVWSRLPHPGRRADLDGALTAGGASGKVELHRLSNGSGFASWSLHQATVFGAVQSADWQFSSGPTAGDLAPDLIGVHQRQTGSGRVEVHVASAASRYTAFTRHTATALPAGDPAQWQFAVGPVGWDGGADLIAVHTDGTASGRVEVSVLSEATNYQGYLVRAVTPLPAGPGVATQWRWLVGNGGDLVGVAHAATGSGRTEVHALSWASGYQSWTMHARTPLAYTTDPQWRFALADYDGNAVPDLFAILASGGQSGQMEVHVLSGATAYGGWLRHAATALPAPIPAAWQWGAF